MISLRSFRPEDVAPIDAIWREHYSDESSLPDRKHMVIDAVVEDEGKVIAYGQVRLFAEAMFFLDKNAPMRSKTGALQLLMSEAFRGADKAGLQLYAFIKDKKFADIIIKHYGFAPVEKGELLLREEI
jgi:hypothetical protein